MFRVPPRVESPFGMPTFCLSRKGEESGNFVSVRGARRNNARMRTKETTRRPMRNDHTTQRTLCAVALPRKGGSRQGAL